MPPLQTVEHIETEMSAEEVQSVLEKENILPLKIETQEDAVKAASAEVIEAMTIGVAQEAGKVARAVVDTSRGGFNSPRFKSKHETKLDFFPQY